MLCVNYFIYIVLRKTFSLCVYLVDRCHPSGN